MTLIGLVFADTPPSFVWRFGGSWWEHCSV